MISLEIMVKKESIEYLITGSLKVSNHDDIAEIRAIIRELTLLI